MWENNQKDRNELVTIMDQYHGDLNKSNTKKLLQDLHKHFIIKNASRSIENVTTIIHDDNPDKQELQLKYSDKVLQSIGLLQGQAAQSNTFIQQIYNDNRTEMPDIVKELFQRVTSNDGGNSSYLDAEIIEEKK